MIVAIEAGGLKRIFYVLILRVASGTLYIHRYRAEAKLQDVDPEVDR